jgi:leucyl-tRNA synthetase
MQDKALKKYNPKEIEPKWQKSWADDKLYIARDFDKQPKYVMLTEFPYPSGDGLHLGHVREYTLGDIVARHHRMLGQNVLYPMGYDAFGLPTENFAIKNKIAPQVATDRNIATFQKQFESLGYSIDWSRSFRTSDPAYYKWTQWLFLQFFKAGMAYQDEIAINWCPKCKTGLANEEVVNGLHERCGTPVEKRLLKQWLMKITAYADRLIDGLADVDYPSRIAGQQINWIGRSVGAEIDFAVDGGTEKVTVYTTRADTLFGATFLVLAPEHPLVDQITSDEHRQHVHTYLTATQAKTDLDRQDDTKEKTGVFTGAYAVNPATRKKIPIWIADYVLPNYGPGAIMAVPAHDERDYEFAKKFDLPIAPVVAETFMESDSPLREGYEMVDRNAAQVIVEHPDNGSYLLLERKGWKDSTQPSFVTGGIDEGEDAVAAAVRELGEETGYVDIAEAHLTDYIYQPVFYHEVKKVNRRATMHTVVIKLGSLKQNKVAEEEQALNAPMWVDAAYVQQKVFGEGCKKVFAMHLNGVFCYTGEGVLVNSGDYSGLTSAEAREKMTKAFGRERVNYRLRDWVFSRQHYWGEPIPIIHCPEHGAVAVPDDQLPVELPEVEHYEPTDSGESPLAAISDWVNTTCPICGAPAKRETDTMPNWAGSSWYYLRYFDPHNDTAFAARDKLDYWGAVDMYLGGMEHTTLHLLYSRFWHQFLYDQGLVPTPEPYRARRGQGIVLATDNSKMSKSKGNVVNPTQFIDEGYGADALRLAIVFLAPYDQTTPWNSNGIDGTKRFLNRVWTLVQEQLAAKPGELDDAQAAALQMATHKTIKKVTTDLEHFNFNTAIAAMMELVNELYKLKLEQPLGATAWRNSLQTLVRLLAPFAPHIAEELWQQLDGAGSVHVAEWPRFDPALIQESLLTIVVQVNGKLRSQIEVDAGESEDEIKKRAAEDEKVVHYLDGKKIAKTIYVPGKLVSFVVR